MATTLRGMQSARGITRPMICKGCGRHAKVPEVVTVAAAGATPLERERLRAAWVCPTCRGNGS